MSPILDDNQHMYMYVKDGNYEIQVLIPSVQ
jgi:hypothetical protein